MFILPVCDRLTQTRYYRRSLAYEGFYSLNLPTSQEVRGMDRAITYHLLVILILVLYPKAECKWGHYPLHPKNHPLCSHQFALANRACAVLPYRPIPPPSPPSPTPDPPAPDPPAPARWRGSRHHRHGHGHRHSHHGHHESSIEEECCRWVQEIDDACVCDLLLPLPPFLTRPAHNYTVMVDESCSVTFECGSKIVIASSSDKMG